ncbi:MAG: hypothetical protein KGI38_12640 [Thaumarchaeota archaeon]|nr:hypothetical protein [Nitrososphaerota archaeon]
MNLKCEECGKEFRAHHWHRFCGRACAYLNGVKELNTPEMNKVLFELAKQREAQRMKAQSWRTQAGVS